MSQTEALATVSVLYREMAYSLRTELQASVKVLREFVAAKLSVPADKLMLTLVGSTSCYLADGLTLSEANVNEGSEILCWLFPNPRIPYSNKSIHLLLDDTPYCIDRTAYVATYALILQHWFSDAKGFKFRIHQPWHVFGSRDTVDQDVCFAVQHDQLIVLLLDVRPPSDQDRQAHLDRLVRHMRDTGEAYPAPKLYAISAFGFRWRAICATDNDVNNCSNVDMGPTVKKPSSINDGDLACWAENIAYRESYEVLTAIVDDIKGNIFASRLRERVASGHLSLLGDSGPPRLSFGTADWTLPLVDTD